MASKKKSKVKREAQYVPSQKLLKAIGLGSKVRGFLLSPSELEDYFDRLAENAAEIGLLVGSDTHTAVENMRLKQGDADSPLRLINNAVCHAAYTLTDAETRSPEFYDTQDWQVLCERFAHAIMYHGELHPVLQLD
ncbi:hypothetical protein [Caudoviricetes sp.]|nr:hypothetical protein [Caudoviricetes sp.]